MNTVEHNSKAWNKKVEDGVVYTKPVNEDRIEKAKTGDWEITVTTGRAVPKEWFPSSLKGLSILCLASGGGQQGPMLAAAGAEVTVVDISEKQLEQDQFVAERDGLHLNTIQGSMSDLHFFNDESFDLIVHPVSNVFVENILPVWMEASRVLKENGVLISGFTNPLLYIFDDEQEKKGFLEVKHSIPFSSVSNINEEELQQHIENNQTLEFGHTLEDQIQGQVDAGFLIAGLYEDDFGGSRLLDNYIKTFIATRAIKVSR
ncbi:class I SAM-dependent methyltransferase [Halobacillus shinanisalinarum]|uniref:Class I SAM-dependent methyltransferase n=1 Tax=Halobacillus shinanisalinarum TaxID=2932258 RepID=A0ABY4GZY0_9BACI|nr:class I SAM-dependent methyltransferase [Halobacillus shinanisalinarum]UOQ93465.1 class I SAM-dependent methyltransferase [Halobacillus shinanisalinarum]